MTPVEIVCPQCGCAEWKAVEQFTSLSSCRLERSEHGVEILFDMQAELSREASTSVVTMYLCGEACGFSVEPLELNKLGK